MAARTDLLQGSLDLIVLRSLVLGPLHGWGISKRLRDLSGDAFEINQGSLYPALFRLERRGWIEGRWGTSPEGRKVKVYALTEDGREQLATEVREWTLFSAAVARILAAQ